MSQRTKRFGILGQAGATVRKAGLEVIAGDVQLLILAEDVHHLVRVDAQRLADIANLICEYDLQPVVGVAHVLHDLSNGHLSGNKLGIDVGVQLAHHFDSSLAVRAHYGNRRVEVVTHRSSLAQELRVRDHSEVDALLLS